MNIDQKTLAARLKNARLAANLTQEDVANTVDLPRSAIAQIEAGNRVVSSLELARLSSIYKRDIVSFFEPEPQPAEETLVALFRAANVEGNVGEWQSEVNKHLEVCRLGVKLETRLGRPPRKGPPSYDLPLPQRTMEAVEQGNAIAEQERRRLGLGHNPISDMADLINSQNIWASGARFPAEMSGVFLNHSSCGMFILVNFDHPRTRKRFSYAHEYAHALLDREQTASLSLDQDRSKFGEVRANAFAAAFLLPRSGVWAFLNSRFKGGASFVAQAVYDPTTEQSEDGVHATRRAATQSQVLTYEDVAALAHHFGVSYQAALYRLKSLEVLRENEFSELKAKEDAGEAYREFIMELGGLKEEVPKRHDREIIMQVVHLVLEAYRRGEVQNEELREISKLLEIEFQNLLNLAVAV